MKFHLKKYKKLPKQKNPAWIFSAVNFHSHCQYDLIERKQNKILPI